MITLYHRPTCSKSRAAKKLLDDSKVKYELINYTENPLTVDEIKGLLKKLGMSARDLLRTKEEIYRRLNLADKALTNDQLLRSMANNPELIERPIIVKGKKAVIGKPIENLKALL